MSTSMHENTKVVLITNGDFPKWGKEHSIPNVKANSEKLRKVIIEVIGVPEQNISSYHDQKAPDILGNLQKIVKQCTGDDSTLIVYYAGHGMPISDQGLFWATNDTTVEDHELLYSTAIRTSEIKLFLEKKCNAKRKILIADCCYSAEFLAGTQGDVSGYLEKTNKIDGTFYMFSSNADSESTFPVDKADEPTYFTNALIFSIKQGIDAAYEYCKIGQLFNEVVKNIGRLKQEYNTTIPDPAKRVDDFAEEYILYRNPKYHDASELELNDILANPNKTKIVLWLKNNAKHPRRKEAFDALKAYDSAETEIKKAKTLPADQRPAALLDLVEKNFNRVELMQMALDIYSEESGLSAKPEQQLESAVAADSIHNNTTNSINSNPRSAK
jgi:hypothetical protein